MKKLPVALILTLSIVLLTASPVYAIADPTSISLVTPIQFYHNLLETGDTLAIVKYNIVYGENPDESVSEAYLGRLLDSDDEPVGSVEPYNYQDDGYGYGIFSLYFEADEVTWEGTYTMELVGNPGLSWTTDPPVVYAASLNWNDSNSGLGNYVLTLADELEVAWDINLVETSSSGIKLTGTYGEAYFTNVIPNLRLFTPGIFSTATEAPQFIPEAGIQNLTLAEAGYVDCVSADIGRMVTDDAADTGVLVTYNNTDRQWWIRYDTTIADTSVMAITAGTGAGTASGDSIETGHARTYMQQLLDRWVGTDYHDAIDSLADYFNLPRNFFTGGFFFILMMVGSYYMVRATHSAKPLPLFLVLLLILGALSGLISALAPILMAVAFTIFIGYILFYRGGT